MKQIQKKDWQIFADVGSNHNGDLERAKTIIREVAKLNGVVGHHFNGVKFQLFREEMLWAPSEHSPEPGIVKAREMNPGWIQELIAEGKQNEIDIGFTSFDDKSMDAACEYAPSIFFKVSSFDILRLDFIERNAVAALTSGRPLHLSTGGADVGEVEAALDRVARVAPGHEVYLYHCVSQYPVHPANARIPDVIRLEILARKYAAVLPITLGWSDHTRNAGVICRAMAVGAGVVEVHVDLNDCSGAESRHGHCWTIAELMDLGSILRGFHDSMSREEGYVPDGVDLRADPIDGLRPRKKYRFS